MGSWVCGVEGVVGHLRCPFVCAGFHRASASPRGGAAIAMPLHGIWGYFLGALLQSALGGVAVRAQVAFGSLYHGYS